MIITGNEVNISLFDKLLSKVDELIINVKGKNRFVVLDIDRYKELRAKELDISYITIMEEIKDGNFKIQTAKEHINELLDEI